MHCPTLNELPSPPIGKTGWPWTEESPKLPKKMPDGRVWPRVSIVTPSYNQGDFIEATIRSVLLQGYPNLEYIIVDGGSTDNTLEVIQKYESWLSHWVSEKDRGQSHAVNKGWKKSKGDIVAWINGDDTYNPGAVGAVVEILYQNDDTVLVSGVGNIVDASGTTSISAKVSPDIDPVTMLKQSGGVPVQPSVFLRRRVLDEVGYLNVRLHYVMDWEYWIRIGLHYSPGQFRKTARVLSNSREWGGTKTNRGWKMICWENRLVFDRIFKAFGSKAELKKIKRLAYSASYRKQALLAQRNGQIFESIRSLIHALALAPLAYNPLKELYFVLSIIIGHDKSIKLKQAIGR